MKTDVNKVNVLNSLYKIFIIIVIILAFSGCVNYDEKFTKNENFKVFKVFISYQSGYYYKILYYSPDENIDSVEISEKDLDIYDSNKSILIYMGNNKWRLYINSSYIDGMHSKYMSGKIYVDRDIKEIPPE